MKTYIGTKIVKAEAMRKGEAEKVIGRSVGGEHQAEDDGYLLLYPDGYESWSPKDQFEIAYREIESGGMSFGLALETVKKGLKIARKGWNGKDMFVFLREGRQITGVDSSTPMGGDFESRDHLCMKDVQGKCVVGWLASQTDMLADDWFIVT